MEGSESTVEQGAITFEKDWLEKYQEYPEFRRNIDALLKLMQASIFSVIGKEDLLKYVLSGETADKFTYGDFKRVVSDIWGGAVIKLRELPGKNYKYMRRSYPFQGIYVGEQIIGIVSWSPFFRDCWLGSEFRGGEAAVWHVTEFQEEARETRIFLRRRSAAKSKVLSNEVRSILHTKSVYKSDLQSPRKWWGISPKGWIELARRVDTSHRIIGEKLRPYLQDGDCVANLASGPALDVEVLGRKNVRWKCLDMDKAMLDEITRPELEDFDIETIEHTLGQGEPLPLGDETANHVIINGVLEQLPSLKFTLLEALRILKPGGTLHFSFMKPVGEVGVDFFKSMGGENPGFLFYDRPVHSFFVGATAHLVDRESLGGATETFEGLDAIPDGLLDRARAKQLEELRYAHKLEDVHEILEILGFEELESPDNQFVYKDPRTAQETFYTFISCRKGMAISP